MDITWYTPQSVPILSCCGSVFMTSEAGAGVVVTIDEGSTGVGEVDPIVAVGEGTVEVDSDSTSTRFASARVEGRKVPYLLT